MKMKHIAAVVGLSNENDPHLIDAAKVPGWPKFDLKINDTFRLIDKKGNEVEVNVKGAHGQELVIAPKGASKESRLLKKADRYDLIEKALWTAGLLSAIGKL